MSRLTMKRIGAALLLCAIVGTAAFIFGNSNEDSVKSNAKSDAVIETVQTVIPATKKVPYSELDYAVRKCAHALEFALLGAELCALTLISTPQPVEKKRKYISHITVPMFFALAAAVTDEFIQSFNDRTSSIRDVLIDFSGASVGILVVLAALGIVLLVNNIRGRKKAEKPA